MTRTFVLLSTSQRQRLTQRSKETGAPLSALIRMAIDAYLHPAKPALSGSGKLKRSEVA